MARPSEPRSGARHVADLLGLGSHSARKSHYPELSARLEELERERNRYKWLFEHAVHGIFQARLNDGLRAAEPGAGAHAAVTTIRSRCCGRRPIWPSSCSSAAPRSWRELRQVLRAAPWLFGYETSCVAVTAATSTC